MQLRELVLHDYRAYGGKQTIQLAPKSPEQPIILIGGLNGAGKTTLLDALQLVLYGQRARCASRGSLAYKDYLRQAIHRNSPPEGGASLELSFHHVADGETHEIRVVRGWRVTGASVRDWVEVIRDGTLDPLLTEQWDDRVDDYVPQRIAHLFFFDSEKIIGLAEEEGSADLMRTAVHALLGLDLVDRLVSDLSLLDQRTRRKGKSAFDRTKVEDLSATRERLGRERQERADELGDMANQLGRAKKLLDQVSDQYKREGGELAEQRVDLERQLQRTEGRQAELRARLRELVHGVLPLASVGPLLATVETHTHREQEGYRFALAAGVLQERDQRILEFLAGAGLDSSLLKRVGRFLSDDLPGQAGGGGEDTVGSTPEFALGLDRLLHAELPAAETTAREVLGELGSLEEKRVLLARKLESIPEESLLRGLRESREEARGLVETLEMRSRVLAEERDRLKGHLEAVSERYRRELEVELKAAMANERLHRKLDRMQLASETLAEFRAAILRRNLSRVEEAVLEAFKGLVRKPKLIQGLRIDPETFALQLEGPDGLRLGREQLSAGEAQLLAVSFLWGLARVSGLPLPVVIDTPLGRLDSEHRKKLVNNYFPRASHQVLLLSTDEEIEVNRLEELKPFIGRSYILEHVADTDRTVVRPGYFWN
jgi:DNA sulfur modification protein DndD